MEQLKAHYDRFLLAAAGLLLAGVSLLMALDAGSLAGRFAPVTVRAEGAAFENDPGIALLADDQSQMEQRRAWNETGQSLFVSRVYLLREGRLVDILESGTELFPGIANAWILEYNLDYTDATLPRSDPDADGFTNLEEFMAKTNPQDAASKPAVWTKLRVTDSKIDKLRVKFMSLPTGSLEEVSLNTISAENPTQLSGSTRFYRKDDPVVLVERGAGGKEVEQATPLKFERAEMRKRFNPTTNTEEEIPVAFLRNAADGVEIELQRGEVKDSPYSLATLRDTRTGGQTYQLRSGETFQLEGETYKLVDVQTETAMIQNLQSGEQHEVPFQAAAPVPEPASEPVSQ